MQENEPKKMTKHEKSRFIEEHREEILEDIGRLGKGEVCKKWGFSGTTYFMLKRGEAKAGKQPGAKVPSKPSEVVELSEHEHYLVLLGYQQAVREILKRC